MKKQKRGVIRLLSFVEDNNYCPTEIGKLIFMETDMNLKLQLNDAKTKSIQKLKKISQLSWGSALCVLYLLRASIPRVNA